MFFDMLCNTLEILLTFTLSLAWSGMWEMDEVAVLRCWWTRAREKSLKCVFFEIKGGAEKTESHSCVTLFKLDSTLDTQAEVGMNEDIQIILINDHLIKSLFIMCWAQNKQQHCCGHRTKLTLALALENDINFHFKYSNSPLAGRRVQCPSLKLQTINSCCSDGWKIEWGCRLRFSILLCVVLLDFLLFCVHKVVTQIRERAKRRITRIDCLTIWRLQASQQQQHKSFWSQ